MGDADIVATKHPPGSAGKHSDSNVYADSVGTTQVDYVTPAAWRGKWVSIYSAVGTTWIRFGAASPTVVIADDSAESSGALTPDVNTGWPIPATTSVRWFIPIEDAYFTIINDDASGRWVAYCDSAA